jgi:hypothetical protein
MMCSVTFFVYLACYWHKRKRCFRVFGRCLYMKNGIAIDHRNYTKFARYHIPRSY